MLASLAGPVGDNSIQSDKHPEEINGWNFKVHENYIRSKNIFFTIFKKLKVQTMIILKVWNIYF
jgi:hypothetical protein